MNREEVLRDAEEMISAIRDEVYGDPLTNHQRIADMWSAILDVDVRPEEVVLCMIAVKMSRLCRVPDHRDSWTDIAGYAALGGEIADNFFDAVDDMKDTE
tara:strand:+ start:5620 stop:5919 length:300 start_codon:yes stop_codon:yes gene_type:complete